MTINMHISSGSQTATTTPTSRSKAKNAIEFSKQAEKLGLLRSQQADGSTGRLAAEAKFITAQDPIIQTQNGGRLPAVPLSEALKLNRLRDELEDRDPSQSCPARFETRDGLDGTIHGVRPPAEAQEQQSSEADATLGRAIPPTRTNPLFPPLPMYGPPTPLRDLQAIAFRVSSGILSFLFLLVIMLGAFFTSVPEIARNVRLWWTLGDAAKARPFYAEEKRRAERREREDAAWAARDRGDEKQELNQNEEFVSTEGGLDPLVCDVAYYARRVGLDCETFHVQTEDGFIIELWHIYNPLEQKPKSAKAHEPHSPNVFGSKSHHRGDRYPVLLIHGLLQSSGAYCCTDENSLAFYLVKGLRRNYSPSCENGTSSGIGKVDPCNRTGPPC